MKTLENTIVAFHIGRGGRFHNSGFLTFLGEQEIGEFTDDLFIDYDLSSLDCPLINAENKDLFYELLYEDEFEELNKMFGITKADLGEKIYFDSGGNGTELTESEFDSGIGKINIDGEYNTTYTCYLKDCSEMEIKAIESSDDFNKNELLDLLV